MVVKWQSRPKFEVCRTKYRTKHIFSPAGRYSRATTTDTHVNILVVPNEQRNLLLGQLMPVFANNTPKLATRSKLNSSKKSFQPLSKLKNKNEFNQWVSFSPEGSGPGTGSGFMRQKSASSSGIGLIWAGRPGLRTYDEKSNIGTLA